MLSKIFNISHTLRIGYTLPLIECMAFACEEKDTVYRMFEEKPHSEIYSKYRPTYPEELKQSILSYMAENGCDNSDTSLALDVGCGTGISSRLSSFTCCWGVDIRVRLLCHSTFGIQCLSPMFCHTMDAIHSIRGRVYPILSVWEILNILLSINN